MVTRSEIEEGLKILDDYIKDNYVKGKELPKNANIEILINSLRRNIYGNSNFELFENPMEILSGVYEKLIGYTQIMRYDKDGKSNFEKENEYIKLITKEKMEETNKKVNPDKDFLQNLKVKQESIKRQPEPEKILVISDLHGDINKWEAIKSIMKQSPNTKITILGDAMDRGEYGVEILLEIEELSKKGKIEYLPGNHDIFTYNYLVGNGTVKSDALKQMLGNGGEETLSHLQGLTVDQKFDLVQWLGNLPIQAKKQIGDSEYCLSHAVFDEKLYRADKDFNLKEAYNIRENYSSEQMADENNEAYARFKNCMWYREQDERTHFSPLALPQNGIMIIGHTPSKEGIRLEQIGNKKAICVDCGRGATLNGAEIDEKGIITKNISNSRDDDNIR